jgi:hypothetical protein
MVVVWWWYGGVGNDVSTVHSTVFQLQSSSSTPLILNTPHPQHLVNIGTFAKQLREN